MIGAQGLRLVFAGVLIVPALCFAEEAAWTEESVPAEEGVELEDAAQAENGTSNSGGILPEDDASPPRQVAPQADPLFTGSPESAENRHEDHTVVEFGAGYGSVDFNALKTALDSSADAEAYAFMQYLYYLGSSGTIEKKYAPVTGGLEILGSAFSELNEHVSLGVKGIYFSPGKLTNEVSVQGRYQESLSYRFSLSGSLASVLGGLKIHTVRVPGKVAWSLSLLAGPAFASASMDLDGVVTDPSYHLYLPFGYRSLPAIGWGFEAEICVGVEYVISQGIGIIGGLGVHYCNVGEMKFTRGTDINYDGVKDIRSGDVFKDGYGENINFNFGGMDLTLGVRLCF